MNVRKMALSMLDSYELEGKYVNLALSSHSLDTLTPSERDFLTALLYTTVEHKITYDYYINALCARSPDKIDAHTRNILRLGICQIVGMNKIPDFAAVNETVKLARNKGEGSFVNAVLRSVIREKDKLPLPKREKNAARYLSVYYSFPLWTVKRFIAVFGEKDTEKLLAHFNEIQPTDITVNTSKISRDALAERLQGEGHEVTLSPYSDISLRISGSCDPTRLSGFSEGEFLVQDAACAAAISVLAPKSGERLVDVCACPGGKSFTAAILMKDRGNITSYDIHESKLSLIESGAERLGLSSVNIGVCDGREGAPELFGNADKVICDVPCSGLGVLGKKADIRYKDENSIEGLPALQLEILTAASKYLKAGGRLLYSTCTLNPDENMGVVEKFLSQNKDLHTVGFKIGDISCDEGCFTFLPHIHGTDGFFISLLEKDSF